MGDFFSPTFAILWATTESRIDRIMSCEEPAIFFANIVLRTILDKTNQHSSPQKIYTKFISTEIPFIKLISPNVSTTLSESEFLNVCYKISVFFWHTIKIYGTYLQMFLDSSLLILSLTLAESKQRYMPIDWSCTNAFFWCIDDWSNLKPIKDETAVVEI